MEQLKTTMQKKRINVEEEWKQWNETLNEAFKKAYEKVAEDTEDKEKKETLNKQVMMKRCKGSQGKHQWAPQEYEDRGAGEREVLMFGESPQLEEDVTKRKKRIEGTTNAK